MKKDDRRSSLRLLIHITVMPAKQSHPLTSPSPEKCITKHIGDLSKMLCIGLICPERKTVV